MPPSSVRLHLTDARRLHWPRPSINDRDPRSAARGRRCPSSIQHVAYWLLLVRRGAAGSLQLLHIVRSQYRRIERDGHLVDGASEFERHLVVLIIHRRCAGATDVEGLVERLDERKGMLQCLGGHYLAVHLQRTGAALADTA